MAPDLDYPAAHSMDTEWFAADADGCVGMFRSGATGAVPDEAGDTEETDWVLNTLADRPRCDALHDLSELLRCGPPLEGDHTLLYGSVVVDVLYFLECAGLDNPHLSGEEPVLPRRLPPQAGTDPSGRADASLPFASEGFPPEPGPGHTGEAGPDEGDGDDEWENPILRAARLTFGAAEPETVRRASAEAMQALRERLRAGTAVRAATNDAPMAVHVSRSTFALHRLLHVAGLCRACVMRWRPTAEDSPDPVTLGFFGYDHPFAGDNSPYGRTKTPTVPAKLEELPEEVRGVIGRVRLPVRFAEAARVQPIEHAACRAWGPTYTPSDDPHGKMPLPPGCTNVDRHTEA